MAEDVIRLLTGLEAVSRARPDRVLRLRGLVPGGRFVGAV
jgi:hypothetical protein